MVDPRALPVSGKEEAVAAGQRLQLRHDPYALVALELLKLLDNLAEPFQLPLEP
jgi:hypothetical protein